MKTLSTITKKLWRKHFKIISAPKKSESTEARTIKWIKKKLEEEKIYSSYKKY